MKFLSALHLINFGRVYLPAYYRVTALFPDAAVDRECLLDSFNPLQFPTCYSGGIWDTTFPRNAKAGDARSLVGTSISRR
jgi:hypothetical protein